MYCLPKSVWLGFVIPVCVSKNMSNVCVVVVCRDLWKEWGDSNFQIFSQNCKFHHRRLESLVDFNVLFIYHSEHYGLIFGPYGCHIIFTSIALSIVFPASTLCMYLMSFDGFF